MTEITKHPSPHYSDVEWTVTCGGEKIKLAIELQPDGEYCAVDADNYEGESNSVGSWSKSPVGYGKSPVAAVLDFIEQVEDRANA